MDQKRVFRIVAGSPTDVKPERSCLDEIVQELNTTVAGPMGVVVELSMWERDSRPGFHLDGPQGLIDEVLKIADCDAFVGIFWKRFGTPVHDAPSGTVHEFNTAFEAWKTNPDRKPQILFYFKEKSYSPKSVEETNQWGMVLKFKQTFPAEGMWWPFKEKAEFEKLARRHLTKLIQERCGTSGDPDSAALNNLLHNPQPSTLTEAPKGTQRLELKMREGALSDDVIELAKDYKHATELLQTEWFYRYKPQGARQRYGQIEMIVRTECQEAYDDAYHENGTFGRKMLRDVRKRLRQRLQSEPNCFFNCKYEHLLGVAALLTEACKVWWSEPFEIADEG